MTAIWFPQAQEAPATILERVGQLLAKLCDHLDQDDRHALYLTREDFDRAAKRT